MLIQNIVRNVSGARTLRLSH